MAKAKTKVVISEPRLLLLGQNASGEVARFENVHIGTPFIYIGDVFLKVGKTTAMVLQAIVPEGARSICPPPGSKITFRKTVKVELATVDLSIKLAGRNGLASPSPASDAVTKAQVDANLVHVTSDIASSVLDRAS